MNFNAKCEDKSKENEKHTKSFFVKDINKLSIINELNNVDWITK